MLWRRLDNPGHEWARLTFKGPRPILRGTAVFMEEGVSARLDYRIACNARWETLHAKVLGWVGGKKIDLSIERSRKDSWLLNGRAVPPVEGCTDLDLSFSPSTNLLAIRRLGLEVGEEGEARAAWLTFPDLGLRPLVQWFRRDRKGRYHYRSDNGFATVLKVSAEGFVLDYPPLWTAVEPPEKGFSD